MGYHEQNKTSGKDITNEILAYTGKESNPRWVDEQGGESFRWPHPGWYQYYSYYKDFQIDWNLTVMSI